MLDKNKIEDIFPMSDISKGMIFHSLKDTNVYAYHDQLIYQVEVEEFDRSRFDKAFNLMVSKHGNLRSCFNIYDFDEPIQIVQLEVTSDIIHYDIQHLSKKEQESHIEDYMLEDKKLSFDLLSQNPLWRVRTFQIATNKICILWVCHHAITDGWSSANLMSELYQTYLKLEEDRNFVPKKLKSGYKDFIVEQIIAKKDKNVRGYWETEMKDYKSFQFPGTLNPNENLQSINHYVGQELVDKLNVTAKSLNTSLKNLCFAAYLYTLKLISNQNDFVVGLITNNRPVAEDGDKIFGCFLNTVPFRCQFNDQNTWQSFVSYVSDKLVTQKKYDRLSLLEIINLSGTRDSFEQEPINTFFNYTDFHVYEDAGEEVAFEEGKKRIESQLKIESFESTDTLLDFNVETTFGHLVVYLRYYEGLISNALALRMCKYFVTILNAIADSPETSINAASILPQSEIDLVCGAFNQTEAKYPEEKTILDLFRKQLQKSPDNKALKFGNETISYEQLDLRSDQLAKTLISHGVSKGDVVGVLLERSPEMIISLFGILKAGGAYLPLDPELPNSRIEVMLTDSHSNLVLSSNKWTSKIVQMPIQIIDVEHKQANNLMDIKLPVVTPNDLAYIIYTSGSTGKPKGVMIEHRALVNRLWWMQQKYPLNAEDILIQKTPFTFDVSVWELFWWSISGASLYLLPPGEEKNPDRLLEVIQNEAITVMHFVPTMLSMFLNNFKTEGKPDHVRSLKTVFASGEALKTIHVNDFNALMPSETKLVNLYGPTEATIDVTYFDCPKHDLSQIIPIGKPIANTRLYILNEQLEVQPTELRGELYIAGDGLARGYINNPELTEKRFIFHSGLNERLYKTGDIARWGSDGNIEFLGRSDFQVKLKGFRIELGEIANQLTLHEDIDEAIVKLSDSATPDAKLIAFYTGRDQLEEQLLKTFLSKSLPHYMVPSLFQKLTAFPRTSSGKIDSKKLHYQVVQSETDAIFNAPDGELETKLTEIWEGVLNRSVDVTKNLYQLGGDSIQAMQIIVRMKNAGFDCSMNDIFQYPTIRELSKNIHFLPKDSLKEEEPLMVI